MENPFRNSNTNKRYYTYDYYLKSRYQTKVCKIALDGGFTCPNRDGKVGFGGCYFCSNNGSGEFGGNRIDPLDVQFHIQVKKTYQKWPKAKLIVYFQSFSNTYAPLTKLRETFNPFLTYPNVVGISIATRPDCFNEEIYAYLEELNQKTDLVIELGLQTIFDETATFFNRGYTYETFLRTFEELKKRHIKTLVHLINGLPFETPAMMLESAKEVGKLHPWGMKIHNLYVIQNTVFATLYEKEPFTIMTQAEYVELVVKQLEVLPSDVVIERLTGDGKAEDLIAPLWPIKKIVVLNEIDKLQVKLATYQGKEFHESI